MSNVPELRTTPNPIVVHITETCKEVDNGIHIHEKLAPQDSTECSRNNSTEKIPFEKENSVLNPGSEIIDGKDLFEQEIIQVISSGSVENIFCIDNVKQEFSVTISDGSVEVSNAQFQCYQDLNLIYTENYTPGAAYTHHTCDICNKSFRKKSNLKRHYRSHTGDNPHACSHCAASFPTRSRLKEHELTHTGLRPHVCGICGKSFSRVSNLTRHCRTHSEEKPYQCDRCGGRFIEPTRLREHYLTHVGEKRFACDVCGKNFLKKYNLKRHHRTHTGDHPHVCAKCGKGFSKKIYLLLHMETHGKEVSSCEADSAIETVASNCVVESDPIGYHDDSSGTNENQENKIFSCSECGRNYLKERNLLNHMRRHQDSGNQSKSCRGPLQCDACDATFLHASRLREHLVTHSGEKLYSCALCQRSFGRNSNLLRHLHTHTGEKRFACDVCGRRFGNNGRLKEHLTTHTGEMLYGCKVCGRDFRHRCGLQRHLLVHTGEKPHKCTACGKRFSRRGRLATHCKRHHATSEPKFPNRVEPRLMNIIQNLEARVGSQSDNGETNALNRIKRSCSKGKKYTDPDSETNESSEELEERIVTTAGEKNNCKDGRQTKISKSKQKKIHSDSNYSSEELEELTVKVTPANDAGSSFNLRSRSLPKRTIKTSTKTTTRAKYTRSELNKGHSNKKSQINSKKSVLPCSVSNSSPEKTVVATVDDSGTVGSPKSITKDKSVENKLGLVEESSEQIEIEDISDYQTQVVGNDLDTIVLIKAAS